MENVNMQELKSKITQEVMQELEAKGIKVIPSVYDGDKEALKIIDKFDKQIEEYNEEKNRIMNRYSNQVATDKLADLNEKMMLNKGAAQEELDEIYNKQLHWRQEAIKNKQVSQEFKEMRRDTINLFMALKGSDLEADLSGLLLSLFSYFSINFCLDSSIILSSFSLTASLSDSGNLSIQSS